MLPATCSVVCTLVSLGGEGSWAAQWCSEVRGGREGEWVPCKAGACLVVGLLHCSSPALLLLPNGLSSQIPSPCNRREIIWKGLSFRNDKTAFVINLVEFDTIRSKSKYKMMGRQARGKNSKLPKIILSSISLDIVSYQGHVLVCLQTLLDHVKN